MILPVQNTQIFIFQGQVDSYICLLGHCILAQTGENTKAGDADYGLARWQKHPYTQPYQLRSEFSRRVGYKCG